MSIPVNVIGQVLVRMERSPINPSDLAPVFGRGHKPPPLPATVGLEGCGTVVQSGGYNYSLTTLVLYRAD
jgi:NADPH:quinone reductase-like Zn-dependent oxidoreductase